MVTLDHLLRIPDGRLEVRAKRKRNRFPRCCWERFSFVNQFYGTEGMGLLILDSVDCKKNLRNFTGVVFRHTKHTTEHLYKLI